MTTGDGAGCERTQELAEVTLRGLTEAEESELETHVKECSACCEELRGIRSVVEALQDWPTEILRPSTQLWSRLAKRIASDASSATPLPSDSGSVRWAGEPEWREVAPGISCKLLSTDAGSERVTMLVRLAPGVPYPPHRHAGVEELHLLSGELWIDRRKLHPGDCSRAEPGTEDARVWSETGCTCVLITSYSDVLL